jgi:DNA-directed RNA polymerase specialized sigma24 family protein
MADWNECEDIAPIVRRYVAGDDQAFDELYRRYRDSMVRAAGRAIVHQRLQDVCIDAELIVDKAFVGLRAARNRADLANIQSGAGLHEILRLYVTHQIAHERARNHANKRGGQRVSRIPLDECSLVAPGSFATKVDQAADVLLAQDDFERLRDLLRNPVQQAIFMLRYEGYTVDEICRLVNRSQSSVHRDIVEIRRIYEQCQRKKG